MKRREAVLGVVRRMGSPNLCDRPFIDASPAVWIASNFYLRQPHWFTSPFYEAC